MKKQKTNDHYVERDVSWMYFDHRILEEAKKTSVPLLERISFLGIYSNNLDEFFRVRVASLSRFLEYVKGIRDCFERCAKEPEGGRLLCAEGGAFR